MTHDPAHVTAFVALFRRRAPLAEYLALADTVRATDPALADLITHAGWRDNPEG